jgi:16S rRNA (adenine1518-N6/adenine1519-N6)-dimethyltransferase
VSAPAGVRLLGAGDIRALASRLGVRPTKRLGQNFVVEPGTVRQIAALAGPFSADDVVLEVGPGLGSLTLALLEAAAPAGARVAAVEIDPVLAAELPKTIAERAPGLADHVTVIQADALTLGTARAGGSARRSERQRASTGADEAEPGGPEEREGLHGEASGYGAKPERAGGTGDWCVSPGILAANLPYNVSVPVILHLLATFPSLRSGVVMVQAEVADRMCAGPGSRVYGAPSAKLAWYATARPAGTVPRTVFWPVPNVDSKLVAFRRQPPPAVDAPREQVFAVIDAAFGQRRKTLRAALATWAGSPAEAERVLRAAGVDPGARGESLGIAEFARIAAAAPDAPVAGPAESAGDDSIRRS